MFEQSHLTNQGYNLHKHKQGTDVFDFTDNSNERQRLESPYNKKRITIASAIWGILLAVLVARIGHIQIQGNENYAGLANTNRQRVTVLKAPRGVIYSQDGKKLVNNTPSFDVVATTAELPRGADERQAIIRTLAEITSRPEEEIQEKIPERGLWHAVPVIEHINRKEALVLQSRLQELPGIELQVTSVREYVNGPIYSHILGYDGKITAEEKQANPDYLLTDNIGKSGIERIYEPLLRGVHGAERYEVDATNDVQRFLGVEEPVSGNNITLTIDSRIQEKLYEIIQRNLEEKELRRAVAVAINPKDGGVLSLVNLPTYDNNIFTSQPSKTAYQQLISNEDAPLLNRAIAGEYSPGSTFKMAVAGGALQERLISKNTTYDSTGGLQVGEWFFPDWKAGGHGTVNVIDALSVSANTFFYIIGGGFENISGLGITKIDEYATRFGFGSPLGIDLIGEKSGFLPTKEWKERVRGERWYIGNTYQAAIGQGDILVTPLQLANYIAAIANNGTLYQPHLLKSTQQQNGDKDTATPTVLNEQVIDEDVIKILQEGMRSAATEGSARSLAEIPMPIAGKTGTAQVGGDKAPHAWFASFAPYDDPEIALIILVENGGGGDETAVPIAHEFYQWYASEYNKPDSGS